MITVQPIRYTSRPDDWHHFAQLLGFTAAFPPTPAWSEFDAAGVLAVHRTASGESDDGSTELHLLTDDLDGIEARVAASGFEVRRSTLADIGPMLTIIASTGARVTLSGGARTTASGSLAVQPIWYQSDLAEPRRLLETIGLRPHIASDTGNWVTLTGDGGGLAALHRDEPVRMELSLEYAGDLDALAERLSAAGVRASVIDEAYNRTLLATTPDGDELWVNGAMSDLYGYTRLDGA